MKTRKNRSTSTKKFRFSRKKLIILAMVVLATGGLLFTLTRDNAAPTSQTTEQSKAVSSKGEPAISDTTTTQGSDKSIDNTSSSATSSDPPKTPYGNFVSNHSPKLNNNVVSICTTSVGVRCQISFTKDGNVKILNEKTTDTDGVAYWSWKPQDIGLTVGSWQITATASNGGKTAIATDGRNLIIQP